jgi:hypothetical protein
MSGIGELDADAFFARTPGPLGMPIGTCRLTTDDPGSVAAAAASANAGNVVLDVAGAGSITLAYDASMQTYGLGTLQVDPKDTAIHVRAAGGDVPPFDATVLPADPVVLTSPHDALTLTPSSGDVELTWTASGNHWVVAALDMVGGASVACRFDAGAQRAVIPAALVQQAVSRSLATAAGMPCVGVCSTLRFMAFRATEARAGDWTITVSHALTQLVPVTPKAN